MFDIWNIDGVPTQYRAGRTKRARSVEPVEPTKPVVELENRDPFARYRQIAIEARTRKRILTAAEIMSSPVEVLAPDDSIARARRLFVSSRFRHIPIAIGAAAPVGILSDRDVYRYAGDIDRPLREIMATDVITARPDTSIYEVAQLFTEARIGAMPVVAEGELRGILTRSDILRCVVHAPIDLWS